MLLWATDRRRPGGRNDLERSAPREPASAAADSSLKIGRAPDGFIYLAEEKPVCPLGCRGPFQTPPGLGAGEEGASHSGKQNRVGAWGRERLWQRMRPPLRSPPGCCGAGPSCPGPDLEPGAQLLARPVCARLARVLHALQAAVFPGLPPRAWGYFCPLPGLGGSVPEPGSQTGDLLHVGRSARAVSAPPRSSAPHPSGLTAGSLCHSQSEFP